ncbi:MAG: hypothetical protein WC836_08150 [Desulfobacula sp.]|jgi:hypothetical protein
MKILSSDVQLGSTTSSNCIKQETLWIKDSEGHILLKDNTQTEL